MKIAAGYALIGVLWIFSSGWMLDQIVDNQELRAALERAKGWLYVLVTAGVLWVILDRYFQVIRQSAALLQQSEERCRFALEGSGDCIWDWDCQTNHVLFSREWKRSLGFQEHEVGSAFSEWESRIHPEDTDRVRAEIQRHLRGQSHSYATEHRIRTKTGTYRWVLNRGKVMHLGATGEPLRVLSTQSDITEKHFEKLVMEARLRLLELAPLQSLEQLLTSMLEEAQILTDSQAGVCLILEPLETTFRVNACSARGGTDQVKQSIGLRFPMTHAGVWSECLARKEPVTAERNGNGSTADNTPLSFLGSTRQLAVPVMREHRIAAIVCVANKALSYDENDIRAVSHLADLAWDIADRKRAQEASSAQLDELKRWHTLMLGREDRVQELKREVNELCLLQGKPPRYPSQSEELRLVT